MFNQSEYNKKYYEKNREKLIKAEKERYEKVKTNPDFKAKQKAIREKRHFGIPSSIIFRKSNGFCALCKTNKAEIVHHLEKDGRGREKLGIEPGKNPDSLIGVCRACHIDLHRHDLILNKKTKANGYWARNYDCCTECGTTERRHNGHGLCVNCIARKKRNGAGV